MITKELQNMRPMTGKERLGAHRDSEYLGAEDIEPGSEPVLTISALYNGMITLARGKERHDVIAFAEESVPGSINQVRPLVVNATNRKTLRKLYKATSADALVGKRIQLYLQSGVRDPSTGDKVDGIRIREKIPSGAKYEAPKCEDCKKPIVGTQSFSAEQLAAASKQKYGRCLCVECGQKAKAALEAEKKREEEQHEAEAVLDVPAAEKPAGNDPGKPDTGSGSGAGTDRGGVSGNKPISDLAAQLMAETED